METEDPWKEIPIPANPSDRDRIENAILHMGRIIGMLQRFRNDYLLSEEEDDSLQGIESAAKRAVTWLGVTLWSNEYPPAKGGTDG